MREYYSVPVQYLSFFVEMLFAYNDACPSSLRNYSPSNDFQCLIHSYMNSSMSLLRVKQV
jgi:hypothetical protein